MSLEGSAFYQLTKACPTLCDKLIKNDAIAVHAEPECHYTNSKVQCCLT